MWLIFGNSNLLPVSLAMNHYKSKGDTVIQVGKASRYNKISSLEFRVKDYTVITSLLLFIFLKY